MAENLSGADRTPARVRLERARRPGGESAPSFSSPCTRHDDCLPRAAQPNAPGLQRASFNFACKNHFAHVLSEPHLPGHPGPAARARRTQRRQKGSAGTAAAPAVGQSELEGCSPANPSTGKSPADQSEFRQPAAPANGRAGSGRARVSLLVPQLGVSLRACCGFYFDYFIFIIIFQREKGVFTRFCNHLPFCLGLFSPLQMLRWFDHVVLFKPGYLLRWHLVEA